VVQCGDPFLLWGGNPKKESTTKNTKNTNEKQLILRDFFCGFCGFRGYKNRMKIVNIYFYLLVYFMLLINAPIIYE